MIEELKRELGEKLGEELEQSKDLYMICKKRMMQHQRLNLPLKLWKALNWKTNYFPEVRENITVCVLNEWHKFKGFNRHYPTSSELCKNCAVSMSLDHIKCRNTNSSNLILNYDLNL